MMSLAALVLLGVVCNALPSGSPEGRFLRKEVCYDGLGCFSNSFPWTSVQRPFPQLPDKPDRIRTRFLLYTRENPTLAEEFELLPNKPLMLDLSPFKGTKKTIFIIHGFTQDSRADWVVDMVKEFLKSEDLNIIAVDWKSGAGIPYLQASANTRVVGAEIARMIEFLNYHGGLSKENIHLIGHSLGAHAAGYTGQRQFGLGRISGMDPAQPYFNGVEREVRLDESDANFVDIIHSDASSILLLGLGLHTPSGHVDFYPNEGMNQPGCSDSIGKWISSLSELLTFNLQGSIDDFACSHMRSTYLYAESINPKRPFVGYSCKDWDTFEDGKCFSSCQNSDCSLMGYHADKFSQRGSLYLYTQDAAPFVTRDVKVEMKIASSQELTTGRVYAVLIGKNGITEEIQIHRGKIDGGDSITAFLPMAGAGEKDLGDIASLMLKYVRAGFFMPRELDVLQVTVQDLDSELHAHDITFKGATLHTGKQTFFSNILT